MSNGELATKRYSDFNQNVRLALDRMDIFGSTLSTEGHISANVLKKLLRSIYKWDLFHNYSICLPPG